MQEKRLDVPYCCQNDNAPDLTDGAAGNTQCNTTSHTMLLMFLIPDFAERSRKNGYNEPEDYFKSKLQKHTNSRGDHDGFTRCLEQDFKIESQWRYDLVKQDLIDSINASVPMVLGLQYKVSGHIVIATGCGDRLAYINDPYGIRAGTEDYYPTINTGSGENEGKNDPYSWNSLKMLLFDGGGWGRVVLSVGGKKTGLQSIVDRHAD